ncbi:hypothetical protein [Cypionkella sp.]|uniref:hypothetical protein n=1 Tax=Cypionkella sp. TaxID=2811411 RepID=UPI002748BE7C|nr:hypothetical protein [Cypionkella sp.]
MAVVASAFVTLHSARQVAANPALTPLIERSLDEIIAATDRLMARNATEAHLSQLIATRLAESPRNWVALQALHDEATARGFATPADYDAARQADSGVVAATGDCLSCIWDIATCSLSTALICKAPILLTPIEDLRGLAQAGADYASGTPIDQLDLGLSVIGLGATAAIVATGGTSATLKAGTATLRLARGMGRMSPRLARQLGTAFADGIRWSDLPGVRSGDDLSRLIRVDVLRPVAATLSDLGRVAGAAGPVHALHLLPLVDDAADARHLANAAEALGPRTVRQAEVLGKTRLLRATLRISNLGMTLILGLSGLMLSVAALLGSLAQSWLLRALRRI